MWEKLLCPSFSVCCVRLRMHTSSDLSLTRTSWSPQTSCKFGQRRTLGLWELLFISAAKRTVELLWPSSGFSMQTSLCSSTLRSLLWAAHLCFGLLGCLILLGPVHLEVITALSRWVWAFVAYTGSHEAGRSFKFIFAVLLLPASSPWFRHHRWVGTIKRVLKHHYTVKLFDLNVPASKSFWWYTDLW